MALPLMILTKYHLMFVNELLPTVKLAKMIPKCWYKISVHYNCASPVIFNINIMFI